MFTAALYIKVRNEKQAKCLLLKAGSLNYHQNHLLIRQSCVKNYLDKVFFMSVSGREGLSQNVAQNSEVCFQVRLSI